MRKFAKEIKRVCLGLCIIMTAVYASAFQVPQQENSPAPQPVEKPVIKPILDADIVHQSDAASTRLKEIRSVLTSSADVFKIESDLPSLGDSLARFRDDHQTPYLKGLSLYQLYGLWEESLQYRVQLDDWRSILFARSQILEAAKDELQKMKEQWELTQEFAVAKNYLGALQQRISTILIEIDDVMKILRGKLENIFSLQDQVSSQSIIITEVITRIDSLRMESRERLFALDGPPLWRAPFFPEKGISVFEQIKVIWGRKTETWQNYFWEKRWELLIRFVFFLILASFLFLIRTRSRKWPEEDEALRESAKIFARPISVALLLSLLMTLWTSPQMPLAVRELFGILMIFPLIWFLPGLINPRLRAPLYGLGGLYFFQQIYEQLPKNSLLPRLYLFVTITIAFVGVIWFFKRVRPHSALKQRRWIQTITWFARLCVVLFGVAWFANLFGNITLAGLLTISTFLSIYALIVVLVLVIVADGLMVIFLRSKAGRSLRMIRFHQKLWEQKTKTYFHVIGLFLWIYLTLRYFEIFEPVKIFITDLLSSALSVGSLHISLGDIMAFGITIWISILLARIIRFVLGEDVLPRLSLPRGVPAAISFTAYYLILILGFLLALSAAGIEWSRFALLAGALGVGIGFGLQNLVNNFISGLILIFERPVKVGDTIEFGTLRGIVHRIGIRSSTIRTWEGAEVIVPNGNLISNEFTNWTLSDRKRRLTVPVGVAYGTDPDKVIEILKGVANSHPEVLDDPEPYVFFDGFGESSLDFDLRFSVLEYENWKRIKSEISLGIHKALEEAHIEIPFPQRDLHVRSIDSEVKKALSPKTKAQRKSQK